MARELHDQVGKTLLAEGAITEDQLREAIAFKSARPYLRLGEILMGLGFIRFGQLITVLEAQHKAMRLGQLLVRNGHVSATQLEEALERQARSGQLLGHILVELRYCPQERVLEALEYQRWYDEYSAKAQAVMRANPAEAAVHHPLVHPRWTAAPGLDGP